jgi:hypothetical protein
VTVEALGHTEVVDVGKEATCTQSGISVGKHCSVCDEVLLAQKPITATGHTAVVDPAREATCTETGLTEGSHCSVCAEVLVAQESPPLGEHSYVDGQCTACGKDQQSEGLAYALNGDQKSYTVAGIGTCEDTKLYIPAAYQGLPVTAIKASAFVNCKVTSVVVPDSGTSIGAGAFYGCNSLVEITLPFIGSSENTNFPLGYIFGSTSGEDTPKTSEKKGYTYQNHLGYFCIPETLRKVTITQATDIPSFAFYNCDLIEVVQLPSNIENIGSHAFANCSSLQSISGKTDGVLYIPESVTHSLWGPFSNCTSLTSLHINNTGRIGFQAFSGCTSVMTITIGESVTSIDDYAFQN